MLCSNLREVESSTQAMPVMLYFCSCLHRSRVHLRRWRHLRAEVMRKLAYEIQVAILTAHNHLITI